MAKKTAAIKKPDLHRKTYRERLKAAPPKSPQNERDLKFCERYLVHRNQARAYQEAGFAWPNNGAPATKYREFAAYLDPRIRAVDAVVLNKIAYERKDLLDAMAAIAMANPQDYLEEFEVLVPKDPAQPDGEMVKEHRVGMRSLRSLPREMAYAVEEFSCDPVTGAVTYRMPSLDTKAKMLKVLAENTGAIKKEVTSQHLHVHLKSIPSAQLELAEASLIKALGADKVRLLLGGMTEDDQIG